MGWNNNTTTNDTDLNDDNSTTTNLLATTTAASDSSTTTTTTTTTSSSVVQQQQQNDDDVAVVVINNNNSTTTNTTITSTGIKDDNDDDDTTTTIVTTTKNDTNSNGTIITTATTTSSSIPPNIQDRPLIQVDRNWIQKLLYKYYPYNNNKDNNIIDENQQQNNKLRAYVLAPMVDQSDLPFRILCRKYGCNICYTPMIHAKLYATVVAYRRKFHIQNLDNNIDRPLIAQICGSEPKYLIETALQLAPYVDAIDINCGCPQGIARRGLYGAFLLEQPTILLNCIKALLTVLPVPLTIKVRLVPASSKNNKTCADNDDNTNLGHGTCATDDDDNTNVDNAAANNTTNNNNINNNNVDTEDYGDAFNNDNDEEDEDDDNVRRNKVNKHPSILAGPNDQDLDIITLLQQSRDISIKKSIYLYEQLVTSGIHLLTVHGRTRYHKGIAIGHADWDAIKLVVNKFGSIIPYFANGSIGNQNDVKRCFNYTGVDGIMSSEAILEYPPLFYGMYENDCNCNSNGGITNNNDGNTTDNIETVETIQNPYGGTMKYYVSRIQLAKEYMELAKQYPPDYGGQGGIGIKSIRIHIHRLLHIDLQSNTILRQQLINAKTFQQIINVIDAIEQYHITTGINTYTTPPNIKETSWYYRHRTTCTNTRPTDNKEGDDDENHCGGNNTSTVAEYRKKRDKFVPCNFDLEDDAAECFDCLFQE